MVDNMAVWIIITCCLIDTNKETRQKEYIAGISQILKVFKNRKYKVVIVENNSRLEKKVSFVHRTFLDKFRVPVLYTTNNRLLSYTKNYGIMEMTDIIDCINYFGIQDDDFIVKITGRYVLEDNCEFFKIVDNLDTRPYSAVLRFSQFDEPISLVKTSNCTTGLIGLKCKYVKQIELPELNDNETSIEMKWASVISKIDDSEICFLTKLGIYIRPICLNGSIGYYYL